MNFEVPLVTNMHPEPPPAGSSAAARFNGIAKGWSSTNVGEESMEVSSQNYVRIFKKNETNIVVPVLPTATYYPFICTFPNRI